MEMTLAAGRGGSEMVTEAQLQSDLQSAMKARAADKMSVLRDVIAAVKNLKVEKMITAVPEVEIVTLVRREINKRSEAAEFARKAHRQELVQKNESEKMLLEAYLPQQLGAAELETVIAALAAEVGSTQIGPLMAKLRERHAGTYDGKLASELIKKLAAA
jgi:uncharacterized protein